MLRRVWKRNWVVVGSAMVHFAYACMYLRSNSPGHTTPLGHWPIHGGIAAAWFFFVAVAAMVPHSALATKLIRLVWPKLRGQLDDSMAGLFFCVPQQAMLMLSLFTGIVATYMGQYPDGYVPDSKGDNPHDFIFSDQVGNMAWAVVHTMSLIDWYILSRFKETK